MSRVQHCQEGVLDTVWKAYATFSKNLVEIDEWTLLAFSADFLWGFYGGVFI